MDFYHQIKETYGTLDEVDLAPRELLKAAPGGRTRAQVFADKIEDGHLFRISEKKRDRPEYEGADQIKLDYSVDLINGLRLFDGTRSIYEIPELRQFRLIAKKAGASPEQIKHAEQFSRLRYLTFPATLYKDGEEVRDTEVRMSLASIAKDLADFGFKSSAEEKALRIKNKGDVSEGIMAAGLVAKFIDPEKEIKSEDIWEVIDTAADKNVFIRDMKNKEEVGIEHDWDREDIVGNHKDKITLKLKLTGFAMGEIVDKVKRPNVTEEAIGIAKFVNSPRIEKVAKEWASNGEANKIVVETIGTSDGGKSTTADLRIVKDGEEMSVGNISLKVSGTKQVGQVASAKYDTIVNEFFLPLFGQGQEDKLKEILEKHRSAYEETFANFKELISAKRKNSPEAEELIKVFKKIYEDVYNFVEGRMNRNEKEKEFLTQLGEFIKKKAQGETDKEGLVLVHIKNLDYKVLDFNKIANKMAEELDLTVTFKEDIPSIIIHAKGEGEEPNNKNKFVSFRPKWEYGDASIRQYIDKENSIFDILKDEEEKEDETE